MYRIDNTSAVAQTLLLVGGFWVAVYNPYIGVPVGLLWLLPMFISIHLGASRDRTGWLWGFFLGWLGVLILALMRAQPAASATT